MILKIPVEDRVSTYPGRVVLTPVTGAADTYTMARADEPVKEGTPINKVLFDSKAYTLTSDVTVYVSANGSDVEGDGSLDSPYKTIQKAIDSIPKHLGGYTAEISIASGVYSERIEVNGFSSGRLVIGRSGETFTIDGIDIINSSIVETNIHKIVRVDGSSTPVFVAKDGSNVIVANNMTIDCVDTKSVGMAVENNSHVSFKMNTTFTANNCLFAVTAQWCSFVSLYAVTGTNDVFGFSASQGSIVSYREDSVDKMWSNNADSGGLVLTGNNSSDLSGATLEL